MFESGKCDDCGYPKGMCICVIFGIKGKGESPRGYPSPYSSPATYVKNPYTWGGKDGKKKLQEELADLQKELDIIKEENEQLKVELSKKSALVEELFNRLADSERVSDE
jgi:hypothetical protein